MRLAGAGDRAAVAAMLARAFADDPAMAFIFPDARDRARRLPRLFALLFDDDAGDAGMRLVAPGGEAATLWRAPGHARTPPIAMLRELWRVWRALGGALPRAMQVARAIEAHMPAGDFWYLHVAGCNPAAQGRGLGRAAVEAGLARAAGRLPCYLETANPANLGFYRALGFAENDAWEAGEGGPRFWSMLRPAG